MPQDATSFWAQLTRLHALAQSDDREALGLLMDEVARACGTGDDTLSPARLDLLEKTAAAYGVEFSRPSRVLTSLPDGPTRQPLMDGPEKLAQISPDGRPGVSLITCCMNRTENLVRALDSWLACPGISEIIIVDWTSGHPVRGVLQAAGIEDTRIRVIRVEDEPRWILTMAFNVGFRVASCTQVLKVDADIVLDPGFFERNPLEPGYFIAGNWRTVASGQVYVNGFFYLFKRDLAAIGGFNEYITTYGWDDDDIYDRLEHHGVERRDVDMGTLYHLPHSDAERVGGAENPAQAGLSAWDELHHDTMHKIRTNRLLAHIMPDWDAGKTHLPFRVLQAGHEPGAGDMMVRRMGRVPHPVPTHIWADATYYATLEMASWRLGPRALGLDRVPLEDLLQKPFADLGRLNVEVALAGGPVLDSGRAGYLVVRITPDTLPVVNSPQARAFDTLCTLARSRGLDPVLSGPFPEIPEDICACACVFVPDWEDIGARDLVDVTQLRALTGRCPGQHFQISFDAQTIAALEDSTRPAPALIRSRARLFVDAQHGLGNRLRAIGSGAVLAAKSDREMVVVWQPDDHCDCRFGDLFDYDDALIEQSFLSDATDQGTRVYNYMEVEPGAEKGVEIALEGDDDIYVRAAYVLNNPLSTWVEENRFLRSLRPVDAVRAMVDGVRSRNDVSVHVRMAGGKEYEHLPYEATANWTEEGHRAIARWREKSHFSRFIERLNALSDEGRADRIFLAADTPETYREFASLFGDRLAMLERDIYDRSATQLRFALADALLLGRSPLLLGSTWSSFSELAMRLAPQDMMVELSGADF